MEGDGAVVLFAIAVVLVVLANVLVVVDVVDVVDVVEDVVVVASHSLQVLAQCVMLATRLSHKPCNLKAMHCRNDSVSTFPSHGSTADALVAVVETVVDVEVDVVLVVVSHRLHVLSHPPGATRVSHKPLAKIA